MANAVTTLLRRMRWNGSGSERINRRKSALELVRLSAAVMGIELCYAAETAFVSPTLLNIGFPHNYMSLIWCLSPMLGFFLTPLLGSLSDRCTLSLGRRRPFILILSFGILLGLILVPNGPSIGTALGDTANSSTWSAAFTILGTVLLDFDSDACQSPARAYLLDNTLPADHVAGLSTFTIMAGLGGTFGYGMGAVNWNGTSFGRQMGGQVRSVFSMISVIFVICVLVTVTSFKEVPLTPRDASYGYQRFEDEQDIPSTTYGATDETSFWALPATDDKQPLPTRSPDTTLHNSVSKTSLGIIPAMDGDGQSLPLISDRTDMTLHHSTDAETSFGSLSVMNTNGKQPSPMKTQKPAMILNHSTLDKTLFKVMHATDGDDEQPSPMNTQKKATILNHSTLGKTLFEVMHATDGDDEQPSPMNTQKPAMILNHSTLDKTLFEVIHATDGDDEQPSPVNTCRPDITLPHCGKDETLPKATSATNEDDERPSTNSRPEMTLRHYLSSIIHMPKALALLCLTNFFSWMSLVSYSLYFTDFVGESIFDGDPKADLHSPSRVRYEEGVRFGCLGMSLYSLSCSIYSINIKKLIQKFGPKRVYVGGHLVYSVGMLVMGILRHRVAVLLLSCTAGVMYATLFTMPYLLVANYHNAKMFSEGEGVSLEWGRGLGTDVGVVNSMIFLAQFALSVCVGGVVELTGSTVAIVFGASAISLCGAVSALFLTYVTSD